MGKKLKDRRKNKTFESLTNQKLLESQTVILSAPARKRYSHWLRPQTVLQKVSEYDQEMPQPYTADQPMPLKHNKATPNKILDYCPNSENNWGGWEFFVCFVFDYSDCFKEQTGTGRNVNTFELNCQIE